MTDKTVDDLSLSIDGSADRSARPGVLIVFAAHTARATPIAFERGQLTLGREELRQHGVEDERLSRKHVEFALEAERVRVRDLRSTNGVFVDGDRLADDLVIELDRSPVVRVGHTLMLVLRDVSAFEWRVVGAARQAQRAAVIAGPALALIHRQIEALARAGEGLFIRGESGSGKEIAAKIFHEASPRRAGPLVAVNCAAIPKELAERLFFGATKGAYSGAVTDAQGYLQAARGGTLFLDEVAELDLSVQSKLLRAIETREVIPLGATRPTPVDLGLCAATWTDLRAAVTEGRFREDLYYRIGRPEVRVPPLRERRDEIALFVERALEASGCRPSASLVEAALLRPWPGNIRELFSELRAAAALARAEGQSVVAATHLDPRAGMPLSAPREAQSATRGASDEREAPAAVASGESEPASSEGHRKAVQRASDALGIAQKTLAKLIAASRLAEFFARAERESMSSIEREHALRRLAGESLLSLLEAQEFKQSAVASELGLSRTTLQKLIADLALPSAIALDDESVRRAIEENEGSAERAARALRVSVDALKKRLARSRE
ncbi:MAG: sigma 54-interacting transcriptional regulator [Polyangiales bacterium]